MKQLDDQSYCQKVAMKRNQYDTSPRFWVFMLQLRSSLSYRIVNLSLKKQIKKLSMSLISLNAFLENTLKSSGCCTQMFPFSRRTNFDEFVVEFGMFIYDSNLVLLRVG